MWATETGPEGSVMTKVRGVAFTLLLVGVIAALVPTLGLAGPEEHTVPGTPSAASDPEVVAEQAQEQAQEQEQEQDQDGDGSGEEGSPREGPRLDPDAKDSDDKLIVGGAAVLLLGIVLWGRHVRSKRRNPSSG
ncbi:hypothetical protein H0B56_21185 [Haloechinothrix sp. YIM 98757]|uniref:Uncharacterized protein n=1 Tax=Haloechinothrix aidingensis TaxID=2752311 RepID=A0A838AG11_9PSEU|nr:hypothetical protein [Haloechinothrix aidingensis]MBA0128067.1 hypothetical protein [Haloechinothrix aidingensis]